MQAWEVLMMQMPEAPTTQAQEKPMTQVSEALTTHAQDGSDISLLQGGPDQAERLPLMRY
jgi:hypothetical protein